MKPVLKVDGLTKIYKNGQGIKDISFEIKKGDIFGLYGKKGCGKSTIMKIIAGLSYADEGSIKIFGKDKIEEIINDIGCLIETPAIYEYLSVRENLQLAVNYYSEVKWPRIDEILTEIKLINYANEKTKKFSFEMKQRLGIALALVSNPKLVILDEPISELGIEESFDIREIIMKQSKRGITFLISSSIPHEIESMCNKVGIIKEGKLIDVSSVKSILHKYGTLEKYYFKYAERMEGEI